VSRRLSQALRAPLTVVAAPAGSGKTTALRNWLEEVPLPDAWVTLDADDDTVEAILRHMIMAVQSVRPAFGRTILAALAGATAPSAKMLAVRLIGEFTELNSEFILVLDDFQTIRNPDVHELMRRLVLWLPDSVHLVVATRSMPPWPLARLRALERVVDIGAVDLLFTPPEATALLELTAGQVLAPDVAAAALARAEGWALGIRLIGVALRHRPNVAVISQIHGDSNRDLLQYFLEEVLIHQSAPVQHSLLTSSILDRFTPALCAFVAADDPTLAAWYMPDWLEQADLFMSALDEEPGWYRRHPLCREALQYELRKRHGPVAVARLHHRASTWFAEQGMIGEAIVHALAAGEVPVAIHLAEQHAIQLILAERWRELASCLDMLPADAAAGSTWLLTCRAWTLWQRQDLGRMSALLEQAEARAPQIDDALDSMPAVILRAAIDALSAAVSLFEGAPERALDQATRAREVAGDAENPLYGWAIFLEGVALQSVGQHDRALTALTEALEEGIRQRQPHLLLRALLGLTFVHYLSGHLRDMQATATRLLELNAATGLSIGMEWAHYLLGLVYYEWNQCDRARDHFGWVMATPDLVNNLVQRDSILATVMIDHIEGRAAAGEVLLARLQEIALSTNDYDTLLQLDDFRALLALARGEAGEAEHRLALANASHMHGTLAFLPAPQLIRARALLARGDTQSAANALAAARELESAVESRGHRRRLIEALAVRALAHEQLGQLAEAHEQLTRALSLAAPDDFTRTLVDLGPQLARLLGSLARHGVADGYISRLLGKFVASPTHRSAADEMAARREHGQGQLVEPLTERELTVMRMLGRRLSYAEIAEELTIAPSTVKTHVSNIYGKLGASGRKDAIVSAARLGLMYAD
jgi:LuxR family maltose regulon positive regulatory protein